MTLVTTSSHAEVSATVDRLAAALGRELAQSHDLTTRADVRERIEARLGEPPHVDLPGTGVIVLPRLTHDEPGEGRFPSSRDTFDTSSPSPTRAS